MSSNVYGKKLDPYRKLREPLGVKGIRQSVAITNTPSKIQQNQQLAVRFPDLGDSDVIVPGTTRLAFTITLNSTDPKRTVVQNLGRAIIHKITIRIAGNEVLSIDDADIYHCYTDLWKTKRERENAQYQGIDTSAAMNTTKWRLDAGDKAASSAGEAIANTYKNWYYVPLDFELLESHIPYYQSGLGGQLEYELTFNNNSRVVVHTTDDTTASYAVENISLEYDIVTHQELSRAIRNQYSSRLSILYDRILRYSRIPANKSDSLWNIHLNIAAKSMKGILLLFEEPADAYKRNSEKFYNPEIKNVAVTIEGVPNQLYSQGLLPRHQWEEAKKFSPAGSRQHPELAFFSEDLNLSDVSIEDFVTTKYGLWLDLRTSEDFRLHGSGRRIGDSSSGISIQITKKPEAAGNLNIYAYLIMDAQLNIENGRFVNTLY